ncbi:MAG: trigger factor family protein [Candidatus Cryptobacteroides sp.]|nr:trigger factor family protein [Candidatus Cryptobacteroides sp.]
MKLEKKQLDDLNIELTLNIEKGDYAESVRKKLAQRRRTADFKGFRKGMVPESLVRRVYGDQILAESVNEVISKGLQDFIDENKLRVLGEPLGSEKQPEVEWKDGNDFTFIFDIATYPEFEVSAGKDDVINKYTISASAKDKAEMTKNLKKYYEDKKEEKSDEDIEKELSERLESEYAQQAEWRFSKDVRDYFVAKTKFDLPEAFMKRWLFEANAGKVSKEDVEKDFDGFVADFRWQLVRSAFMRKYDFKVEQKDIQDAAVAYVHYQYAMYGMPNVPEEVVKEAVQNMMQDRSQIDRLVEQVEDGKVLGKLKEEVTVKAKKITSEKFREL